MEWKWMITAVTIFITFLCSGQLMAESDVITISDIYPPDDGVIGTLNPELSVKVVHRNNKPMDIIFRSDASGEWQDIKKIEGVRSGIYKARSRDMIRRGTTYHWEVVVSDGKEKLSNRFSFNLAVFVGPKSQVITHSDCWKYGYIKHGWEKGKIFVTTQRGTWAAYDVNRGWYRTYQRLMRREKMTGQWTAMEDGGNLGHPFWGYWDGMYHVFGLRGDGFGWCMASAKTFEDFGKLIYEKDVKDTGTRTVHSHWQEGTTYTFSEDRAWIMAIDYDEATKRGQVKYWQWTKEKGWEDPVTVGTVSNHTGRVALVRHTRDIWYIFVTEGEVGALDGRDNMNFKSTLKYFKSVDGGKTWSELTDTGIPAHAIWSSVSFARYGDNYYVFLSEGWDTYIYFTRDLENWKVDHMTKNRVAKGMWCRPHGTLLNQCALILTVAGDISYHDEQYGIIVVVPEMISHPGKPVLLSPADGMKLPVGTKEVELSVKVSGPQTYDVAFYLEDGTFIGEDKLLRDGDTARIRIKNLKSGETYRWYAVARGALLEYYGCEPDTTSDEQWSDIYSFSVEK